MMLREKLATQLLGAAMERQILAMLPMPTMRHDKLVAYVSERLQPVIDQRPPFTPQSDAVLDFGANGKVKIYIPAWEPK
jgi:hypothetical protein